MRGQTLFGSGADATWTPSVGDLSRSRLCAMMRRWGFDDLPSMHRASVDDPGWFWPAAADDLGIRFSTPHRTLLDDSRGHEFPRWFVGGELNIVDSCVDRHATASHADKPAVVYEADSGERRALSHRELAREVKRVAGGLAALGVGHGDRVGLFVPVVPEAAVTLLACARLGAVVVPMFSGYGAGPIAERLVDSDAVLLVTVDRTTRRGRPVAMKAVADAALADCPAVRHVVVIPAAREPDCAMTRGRDVRWSDLRAERPDPGPARLDPNHPLMIIYTSGTTGRPKGIVHSHIGYLLKSALDFGYAFDLQTDDVLGWTADMGWMLGPLMIVGGLHFGATVVLIEGAPDHPAPDRIWRIVERNGVTVQGLAPTAARLLMPVTDAISAAARLDTLRAWASTGEEWDTTSWEWLFYAIGRRRVPVLNYTGGTEVGGGILSGYTVLPHRGPSFCGPLLGMDVAVLDEAGEPVLDAPGELALLNRWPGMAMGFWKDDERYLDTYWRRHPRVWVHGDLARVGADGYWELLGRSDDTMKIAGRRVGPGEIESALIACDTVAEAAVIGVPDPARGQAIVGFVVPTAPREDFDIAGLTARVADRIGRSLVPARLHVVPGLPKTKNGKLMRRVMRARYLGEPYGELSALDPATSVESIPVLADSAAGPSSEWVSVERAADRAVVGGDT